MTQLDLTKTGENIHLKLSHETKRKWLTFAISHEISLSQCIRNAMAEYILFHTPTNKITKQELYDQIEKALMNPKVQYKITEQSKISPPESQEEI
jgi:hypothetical protein